MQGKRVHLSEDWLALALGLFIFFVSLGTLVGADLLGWVVKTKVYTDIAESLAPVSQSYSGMSGPVSLLVTYLFFTALMAAGAAALGADVKRFVKGFTAVFVVSYVCWVLGSYAHIAATSNELDKYGIGWSLNLTPEAGYIIALIVGLIVGNFLPQLGASWKEAIRPELYVKTAVVLLGGTLAVKAAARGGLVKTVMFQGMGAILVAYLIFWAAVYYVARRWFRFSREWSVPLASGISICGVSAAIATGSAIRARPVVPIMVSSLVVVFAVVELVLLPFLAQTFLWHEPMVAGSWMALAVKTDGAAVASGAVADALIRAKALEEAGIRYEPDWIMNVSAMVKVFIDIFIGVWAFILAWIWSAKIERRNAGDTVKVREIWERFPKFVLGYAGTFLVLLGVLTVLPDLLDRARVAMDAANVFRKSFFVMTFFTIGVVSNFRKLWEEGIGKLAAVYVLCLFGFIIWVGLAISWIFFRGIHPPVM